MCTSVSAVEIIKIADGGRASCKSSVDVMKSKINNVFVVSEVDKSSKKKSALVQLKISILSCKKNGESFSWAFNDNPAVSKYTILENNITKVYKRKKLMITNDANELINEVELDVYKTTQNIHLTIPKHLLSINNFPMAQDKGNYYFDLTIKTSFDSIVNGDKKLFNQVIYGGYRIFLD